MQKQVYRIGLGVGFDRGGRRIGFAERDAALRSVYTRAATLFGGYFITSGDGGWIGPDGRLVQERGVQITVAVELDVSFEDVLAFARNAGRKLNQHSVYIEQPGGYAGVHPIDYD